MCIPILPNRTLVLLATSFYCFGGIIHFLDSLYRCSVQHQSREQVCGEQGKLELVSRTILEFLSHPDNRMLSLLMALCNLYFLWIVKAQQFVRANISRFFPNYTLLTGLIFIKLRMQISQQRVKQTKIVRRRQERAPIDIPCQISRNPSLLFSSVSADSELWASINCNERGGGGGGVT